MKSWVIYVHEDGRCTSLHVHCPQSAVSYGTHAVEFDIRATRCACVANSHFEPSDLYNGLANWLKVTVGKVQCQQRQRHNEMRETCTVIVRIHTTLNYSVKICI